MFGQSSGSSRAAVIALPLMLGVLASQRCESPPASSAVVFEGAGLIVGDGGPPIENAAFVVDGGQFVQVGPSGEVDECAGAPRVDLTGMKVMPAIIDTHTYLNQERDALIEDLRARARFGVSAAMSLGRDTRDLTIREEEIPGAARFRSAGVGITSPEPGRAEIPYWLSSEDEARQAFRDEAPRKVDIVEIWVDDRSGQYEELSPEPCSVIIDEVHQNAIRVTAHDLALEDTKGLLRAGIDAFAHRARDTEVDEEVVELSRGRPDGVPV